MLQQFNSIVVDASYINKFYAQSSVIGKGKDMHHGLTSISYLMTHSSQGGRYILQIYENLGPDIFRIKAQQLQKCMLECVNNSNTRITLIAEKQNNDKSSDLYILYKLNDLNERLDQVKDPLSPERAHELLIVLCKNLLINCRNTFEFLDIAPQNIYVNNDSFVISNMSISYKGSKFHRPLIPITDSYVKEKEKTLSSMVYSYSFQAGMVILCAITQIHSSEFFFEDGQLKNNLVQQVLRCLWEKWSDQDKLSLKKNFKSLAKVEKPFEQDYKNILPYLQQILSLDQQKRSIFQLLIMHPENKLQVKNPFFQQTNQGYIGFGVLNNETNLIQPEGYGQKYVETDLHSGEFKDDQLEVGTIEIKQSKSVIYILLNLFEENPKVIIEQNKFFYMGEQEKYIPKGEGTMLMITSSQKNLPKKRQVIYYKGNFENGLKAVGQEFYNNKSDFEGKFNNNVPYEGTLYFSDDYNFEGFFFEDMNKKKGSLLYGNQVFSGTFENDQPKQGLLKTQNGSQYDGNFKNGVRSGFGKFTFPSQKVIYEGHFENGTFNGKGTLTILESKDTLDVEYENGRCQTQLPDQFIEALKKPIVDNQKQTSQQKKGTIKQQQNGEDEQIEEDIQENPADDDGDQNYDMNDDQEQ